MKRKFFRAGGHFLDLKVSKDSGNSVMSSIAHQTSFYVDSSDKITCLPPSC